MLVGAHALLANGGVMTGVGCHLTALAAKRHAVPFVVLVGLHKLSPLFPHDPALTFNDFKVPLCNLVLAHSMHACMHARQGLLADAQHLCNPYKASLCNMRMYVQFVQSAVTSWHKAPSSRPIYGGCKHIRQCELRLGVLQSPADVLDFGVIAEVLDGEQGAAGTSGEDLYVHAPNPVRTRCMCWATDSLM